jgi:hypothetical protein
LGPNGHRYTPKSAEYGKVFSSSHASKPEIVSSTNLLLSLQGAEKVENMSFRTPFGF